ncbi:MAG TPA: aminotransferase class I/II-fold pyridoxal phosphate-dependent enzyme [Patescibacteria group bacterium]|nr:aminotransferase class I/II-fold pyridoxal phosphate-dependent enzyme [Patescibacteria group bacterium]
MKMVDYSNNLNGIKPPDYILGMIKDNYSVFMEYDGQEPIIAISSISKFSGISTKNITWCNGTTQAFFTLPRVLPTGKVLIIGPTFWEYPMANERIKENKITFYLTNEENNFVPEYTRLSEKIKDSKVVYLCNPNNPTSVMYDKGKIVDLIKSNSEVYFVVDETYLMFREDYSNQTLTKLSCELPNLYVVTSFSKFYSLPGIRMGFITSCLENIEKYKKFSIPYIHNPLVNRLLPTLLDDKQFSQKIYNFYKLERIDFYNKLIKNNISVLKIFKPDANFILAKVLVKNYDGKSIEKILAEKGLIIRDASIYKGLDNSWLRFSIKSRKENRLLLRVLKKSTLQIKIS